MNSFAEPSLLRGNVRSAPPALRVFISYTGTDLKTYADTVANIVTRLEWVPIYYQNWESSGRPTVSECLEKVQTCNILVVLVAHRYGWVPSIEEGGDGVKSITWMEVDHARRHGILVLPYLIKEDYPWLPNHMESRTDSEAGAQLSRFKEELKKTIVGFFGECSALATDVLHALLKAEKQLHARLHARKWEQIKRRVAELHRKKVPEGWSDLVEELEEYESSVFLSSSFDKVGTASDAAQLLRKQLTSMPLRDAAIVGTRTR